ncbi:FAD-dependent monooxygenase [Leptospira yasudae]|uniref:FAD-dependent oxidoreductase n=1 Tax=Leptospira yasudae TaxID=2202201 RepID=UPI001C4ED021|nr:FAD-dependent monooxygenase [Leptospira yasudae]MBW0434931.1 FAD-dependent monooxygenase [Leptospira yasudae]
MNQSKKTNRVMIIGGGIAGPTLALFLKKAGIASEVYEAHPESDGVGGGFNVASNGIGILAELGLADAVIQAGTKTPNSFFKDEKGKLLAKIRYGAPELYGQTAVSMSRATLNSILSEEMKKQNIGIHYGKRLVSISDTAHNVTAHFEDGTNAEGDLLIGADGIHSKVRKYILPDSPNAEYVGIVGIGGFVCQKDLSSPPENLEGITFTFGPNGFFGHGGGDTGTILWWTNLSKEEFTKQELTQVDHDKIRQELLAQFKGYHEPIETLISNTKTFLRHNIHDILSLSRWSKGRIALIGDAAHAVSPNSGQGASIAMEDAMYLAKLLRDFSGNHMQAFECFERDRKPRVEKIVAEGRRRAGGKEIVTPFQSKMRNLMLKIFIGLFGEAGQKWILSYKIDWDSDSSLNSKKKAA